MWEFIECILFISGPHVVTRSASVSVVTVRPLFVFLRAIGDELCHRASVVFDLNVDRVFLFHARFVCASAGHTSSFSRCSLTAVHDEKESKDEKKKEKEKRTQET